MAVRDTQWHVMGEPAQSHEAAALDALRRLLPEAPITHVWTNVLVRDREGRAGEYDAIVLHGQGSRVRLGEAAASRGWALDGEDVDGVPPLRELLAAPPVRQAHHIDGLRADGWSG